MVSENLTYDILWQINQKEKQSNELQLVPKTLYNDIKELLDNTDDRSSEELKIQKENTLKLINSIFERRKQKIMVYAAYGKEMPSPAPDQDNAFYREAVNLIGANNLTYAKREQREVQLKAIQSIPEIVLPSGNKIGPLEKDQVLNLNQKENEDKNFLINNGICKEM
ncbi:MAG: hypothetical protein M1528_02205 [Candidatus Marsarchaeota archaeon]|jgi:DNA replication initiation complex subunit (GINS family)|nr:hypothetical protein [Candidatus Marsarchaeota archaeon]MCL5115322.1 hypothetical protein [Candidatus Marsarchaeota archaeon]